MGAWLNSARITLNLNNFIDRLKITFVAKLYFIRTEYMCFLLLEVGKLENKLGLSLIKLSQS